METKQALEYVKGELLRISAFSDLQLLLQCWTFMLNDAKASHNEVHAFGSEPCRLIQLDLHTVFFQWC